VSAPRYRGLRFVQPDFEPAKEKRGLSLTPRGDLEMAEDEALVSQAILLLISTRPGERVMRPRYGCDLQQLVFSPNDDTTAGLAEHYVRRALETWEPRIDILGLDAVRDEDASRLTITLEYRLRASQRRDRLVYRFSLEGGAS
jgi:phage baseplate assembly protein W